MPAADAWILPAAAAGRPAASAGGPARLVRTAIDVPEPGPGEVLVAPLYGCWEGNMGHAVARTPIDVCRARGESGVVLGNAGTVRVLRCGPDVTTVEPGQKALVFGIGTSDRWGYPIGAFAYDTPGTVGVLATRTVMPQSTLIPLPEHSRHSDAQWAAFSLRYITAWGNWNVAYPTFRVQMPQEFAPEPHVWAWGGGVSLAELDLARRHGCRTVMLASTPTRLKTIESAGVTPLDRTIFGDLRFDERRWSMDPEYRDIYRENEKAFLAEVEQRTDGDMVQIFVDMIGGPLHRVTTKALGRQSVRTTAGWKAGMKTWTLRATDCISRHQHVNTHYARYDEGVEAIAYAERTGWIPTPDERVYGFDEIPELAADYHEDAFDFFPCFQVNDDASAS